MGNAVESACKRDGGNVTSKGIESGRGVEKVVDGIIDEVRSETVSVVLRYRVPYSSR